MYPNRHSNRRGEAISGVKNRKIRYEKWSQKDPQNSATINRYRTVRNGSLLRFFGFVFGTPFGLAPKTVSRKWVSLAIDMRLCAARPSGLLGPLFHVLELVCVCLSWPVSMDARDTLWRHACVYACRCACFHSYGIIWFLLGTPPVLVQLLLPCCPKKS